jgi:succinyl-diaminopimelate desuccinylase
MSDPQNAVVELTQNLVRIPSENPTGDEVALGRYVFSWLVGNGIETELRPVEGERGNVIGRVRGGDGPPLVLIAHLDTVPIGDRSKWQHDPFGGEFEDGKIYGRGACDMKGGLAAAMLTLAKVQQAVNAENLKLSGDLVLACTIDEEESFMKGSTALGQEKAFGPEAYLLTMEPTNCQLNIAHKGAFWYEASFFGKGAHAANPEVGRDANRAMAEAVTGWYARMEQVRAELPPHPLLGSPTLIVSRLEGGIKTNVVSEYCRAEIDMRIPPPMTVAQVEALVTDVAKQAAAKHRVEYQVQAMTALRPPVECRADSPLLSAFDHAYKTVTGQTAEHLGFMAYTDAAMLAVLLDNHNSVVFGPGLLSDAHTTDEHIEIGQLITATHVLEALARELLVSK